MAEPDDLLPNNATGFERAQSKTSARLLATDTDVIRRARDAQETPRALLPFLAAERSVHHYAGPFSDEFSEEFPGGEAFKRAKTGSSFEDHLAYGAPAALEKEIELDTGVQVQVVEFFEERQFEWPDFAVDAVLAPGEAPPDLEPVRRSAMRRKNVRDTLAAVRPRYVNPPGALYYGAAAHFSTRMANAFAPAPNRFHGAATRIVPQQRVKP